MNAQDPMGMLTQAGSLWVVDRDTLLDYLHKDRELTFRQGYDAGRKSHQMLTKKDAARRLNISEGTIDNLRKHGEIKSAEYCDVVRFRPEEVERYIETHTNLYYTIQSKMNKQS